MSANPAAAVIETAGGVGYLVNITLPTFAALEKLESARMLIHESIRDDAWVLYGFLEEDERELFRALVGVSGVGADDTVGADSGRAAGRDRQLGRQAAEKRQGNRHENCRKNNC